MPECVYHVSYNLERYYPNLHAAEQAFKDIVFQPAIPRTKVEGEDKTIPRICVAPTICDCITAIGADDVFRRCVSANEHTYSYATRGDEIYPVVISVFPKELAVYPPTGAVPDIGLTNELWICQPARPTYSRVAWLDQFSLSLRKLAPSDRFWHLRYVCIEARFTKPMPTHCHPWLNDKGHTFDSVEMESED